MPVGIMVFVISAAAHKMKTKQVDVSSSYLHLDLDEPVYAKPTEGVPEMNYIKIWNAMRHYTDLKTRGRHSF